MRLPFTINLMTRQPYMETPRIYFAAQTACVLCALVVGCSEDKGPRTVKNPDPTVSIPAIQTDVQNHDQKDVVQMVANLDDDDPAVRFYSIQGLQRLTGDDFGYRYYDDKDGRAAAVAKWQEWLKQRKVAVSNRE
jgi:hypothetical protein